VSVNQVSRRSDGGVKVYGYATTGMPIRGGNYGYNGYGYDNNGYGQYGYQQQADARFNCSIDRYGRIKDIDAERTTAATTRTAAIKSRERSRRTRVPPTEGRAFCVAVYTGCGVS